MRHLTLPVAIAVALLPAWPAAAQHDHHHHDHDHHDLGAVSFETACGEVAQAHFDTGLALLHHMMYDQARPHFEAAAEAEEACAMAYWGVAMTQLNPLWAPSTPDQKAVAREAIRRAQALEIPTRREQMYIDAVAAYFDGDDGDHAERLARWHRAQEEIHRAHADDVDAAAFWALAHLSIAPPDERGVAYRERGGDVLEPLLAANPAHPGLYHYLIHLYDFPALAERAAGVAEAYDAIAPDVPHALHMPSHIFVRVGEWPGTIEWNRRSADAALAQPVNGATSFHYAHALDYMAYAYLQQGEEERAREVMEEILRPERYQPHLATAYAVAAVPARLALEREAWEEAASLESRPVAGFPWDRYPAHEAITHFARGIGAARSGDVEAALAERERLDELHAATLAAGEGYWATLVDAHRQAVSAWATYADGRQDEALELMREAADLEDSVDKHPVSPGDILPARELYGDMLLDAGRAADARRAYLTTLETSPNRLRSHYGAARAALQDDDVPAAHSHFEQIVAFSTGDTPAIREAREFLARR